MKSFRLLMVSVAVAALLFAPNEAFARRRRGGAFAGVPSGCSNRTAQDVANCCAADGRLAHRGGNPGYEGLGMASTPEAAYRNCCYANSGMKTVDVGYAKMRNGSWVCCRRYGR
jgi:hypothetical protein